MGRKAYFKFSIVAPSTPGTYTFSVQMVQDGVATFGETKSFMINVQQGYALAVDCGATSGHTDSAGIVWLADQAYGGGNTWGYTTSNTYTTTDTISGTDDQTLFRTERVYSNAFSYKFDCPNGRC